MIDLKPLSQDDREFLAELRHELATQDDARRLLRLGREAGRMSTCAKNAPIAWCSCDLLKQAQAERYSLLRLKVEREAEIVRLEAERDAYRTKALNLACRLRCAWSHCPDGINQTRQCCKIKSSGTYCDAVIKEVDA